MCLNRLREVVSLRGVVHDRGVTTELGETTNRIRLYLRSSPIFRTLG